MPKHNSTETLNIVARSPFELYFDGEAVSLSASNRIGAFDILPGHADFFSMLQRGEVTISPIEGEPVKIDANSGILTVRNNEVYLFVNM